jgi:hypothetical protein
MTCAECMDALLVADFETTGFRVKPLESIGGNMVGIEEHIASCETCTRAAEILRTAQEGLSASLALASAHKETPQLMADYAYKRVRRERLVWWTVLPVIIVAFVFGAAMLATNFGPGVRRYFTPPPTVETRTFSLSCLSGEQAASLLTPYLPSPQNPMWQAEAFDVRPAGGGIRAVTVRAPGTTLALVPVLLERFERDPNAACRR